MKEQDKLYLNEIKAKRSGIKPQIKSVKALQFKKKKKQKGREHFSNMKWRQ